MVTALPWAERLAAGAAALGTASLATEARADGRWVGANGLDWQLLPGQLNRFEFSCWRWSGLGLGALATAFLLATSLLLQQRLLKAPTDLDRSPDAPL